MATAPFVRGFVLAYQMGKKSFIGCVPCVRKRIFGEVGLSALLGWFSITALIINPFLIIYNFFQGLFVKEKPFQVAQKLKEFGIPENPANINVTQIGYALAAAMIRADGKVEEAEIEMAEKIGEKIFSDFDEAAFRLILKNQKELPSVNDLTTLLKDVLNEEGKVVLFQYLLAIAQSDGHVDDTEKMMLMQLAANLNIDVKKAMEK